MMGVSVMQKLIFEVISVHRISFSWEIRPVQVAWRSEDRNSASVEGISERAPWILLEGWSWIATAKRSTTHMIEAIEK